MDFLSIAVLIVFVLLGGIIAVIADELGRRIGKKRLVLHKRIRPKHTARIVTFLSGMTITIVTMTLIAISSEEMRTLLTRGRLEIRELTRQRQELERSADALRLRNQQLLADRERLADEVRVASNRVKQANAKAKIADDKAKTADDNRVAAESRAKDAEARGNKALADYHRASSKLAFAQSKLASVQKVYAARQKEYQSLSQKYSYVYKEWRELLSQNNKLQIQQNELSHKIAELDRQLEQGAKDLAAKNKEIEELQGLRLQLQKENDDLETSVFNARQRLIDVQRDLMIAENQAGEERIVSRFATLIYAAGEELARIPIPAGTSKDQVKSRIDLLINDAQAIAKQRGAASYNGVEYAGMIEDPITHASVSSQKDLLAAELAGSSNDEVLIAYAKMNAFKKESVVVGFAHKSNPVIYQPGQMIAEIRINGREPAAKIMESLSGLGDRVRKRALDDKMIPVQRGDMSLGKTTAEDIVLLYDKIRESGGSVRVQARAKRLTRAADPLLLDFEVR